MVQSRMAGKAGAIIAVSEVDTAVADIDLIARTGRVVDASAIATGSSDSRSASQVRVRSNSGTIGAHGSSRVHTDAVGADSCVRSDPSGGTSAICANCCICPGAGIYGMIVRKSRMCGRRGACGCSSCNSGAAIHARIAE
jgi:hypothetical protein